MHSSWALMLTPNQKCSIWRHQGVGGEGGGWNGTMFQKWNDGRGGKKEWQKLSGSTGQRPAAYPQTCAGRWSAASEPPAPPRTPSRWRLTRSLTKVPGAWSPSWCWCWLPVGDVNIFAITTTSSSLHPIVIPISVIIFTCPLSPPQSFAPI